MDVSAAYLPWECFAAAERGDVPVPRVFISPQRYIQGRGVLRSMSRYLSLLRVKRAAILVSERGRRNEGGQLLDDLRIAGIESVVSICGGECSVEAITAHTEALSNQRIDCVIAVSASTPPRASRTGWAPPWSSCRPLPPTTHPARRCPSSTRRRV